MLWSVRPSTATQRGCLVNVSIRLEKRGRPFVEEVPVWEAARCWGRDLEGGGPVVSRRGSVGSRLRAGQTSKKLAGCSGGIVVAGIRVSLPSEGA